MGEKKVAYIVTHNNKSQELFLRVPDKKYTKVSYSKLSILKKQIKNHNAKLKNSEKEYVKEERFDLKKFSNYYQLDISKFKIENVKIQMSNDNINYIDVELKAKMIFPKKVFLSLDIKGVINKVIYLD